MVYEIYLYVGVHKEFERVVTKTESCKWAIGSVVNENDMFFGDRDIAEIDVGEGEIRVALSYKYLESEDT